MDIALRERDGNPLGVKGFLGPFDHVEVNPPVISRLDPGAHDEVHAVIRQLTDKNGGRRILENSVIPIDHGLDHAANLVEVIAVANTKDEVAPPVFLGGKVGDIVAGVRSDSRC